MVTGLNPVCFSSGTFGALSPPELGGSFARSGLRCKSNESAMVIMLGLGRGERLGDAGPSSTTAGSPTGAPFDVVRGLSPLSGCSIDRGGGERITSPTDGSLADRLASPSAISDGGSYSGEPLAVDPGFGIDPARDRGSGVSPAGSRYPNTSSESTAFTGVGCTSVSSSISVIAIATLIVFKDVIAEVVLACDLRYAVGKIVQTHQLWLKIATSIVGSPVYDPSGDS